MPLMPLNVYKYQKYLYFIRKWAHDTKNGLPDVFLGISFQLKIIFLQEDLKILIGIDGEDVWQLKFIENEGDWWYTVKLANLGLIRMVFR